MATYVTVPDVDPRLSPRPFLHPVRTLGGVVVSDLMPDDHPHHLGVSLGIQDVNKVNLWGGRTYVRDVGYEWLDDHGTITHEGFETVSHNTFDTAFEERLTWRDTSGGVLLDETRQLRAGLANGDAGGWTLDVQYALRAPADRAVVLGSPATNGRPGGAGYGGFFWRIAPCAKPPRIFTAVADGETDVNGSAARWLAFVTDDFSLVFRGLADDDRWFVRAEGYPGVCVALALQRPLTIDAGATLRRRHTVVVVDGALSRAHAMSAAAV